MRKLLAILLALSMVFTFAACGKDGSDDKEDKKDKTKVEDKGEASVMGSLSFEEVNEVAENFEEILMSDEEKMEAMENFVSEIEDDPEFMDDYGYTEKGIEKLRTELINIYSGSASDEIIEQCVEFYCSMMMFQRVISEYEEEYIELQTEIYEKYSDMTSDGAMAAYIEFLVEHGVPEWFADWFIRATFAPGGAVEENAATKTCVANQREIISSITNFIMCEAYDRPIDIDLEFYYKYGTPAYSIMGDGMVAAEIESMFVEFPCCPADGIIEVHVYNDGNGNYSVDTSCRDNTDGDHNNW